MSRMQILALARGDLDLELYLFRVSLMGLWLLAPSAWYRGSRWMGLDRLASIAPDRCSLVARSRFCVGMHSMQRDDTTPHAMTHARDQCCKCCTSTHAQTHAHTLSLSAAPRPQIASIVQRRPVDVCQRPALLWRRRQLSARQRPPRALSCVSSSVSCEPTASCAI